MSTYCDAETIGNDGMTHKCFEVVGAGYHLQGEHASDWEKSADGVFLPAYRWPTQPPSVQLGQVWERKRDGQQITIGHNGTSSNEWRWRDRFGSGGVIFQETLLDASRYRLIAASIHSRQGESE